MNFVVDEPILKAVYSLALVWRFSFSKKTNKVSLVEQKEK
jgi:hypothetical protein